MMVLDLAVCPDNLRGDLTKWLMEISAGVFVGQVSARVREKLWQRVKDNCKSGRAILVYNTNNEQKLSFRTHGETWEPIDFDGIKLMLRPSPSRLKAKQTAAPPVKTGFSTASKIRAAKCFNNKDKAHSNDNYVVVDIETTGLNPDIDKIIEVSALRIANGEPLDSYYSLVCQNIHISAEITALTGIANETIKNGKEVINVLEELQDFIGGYTLVSHNADFDKGFLNKALSDNGLDEIENNWIDTLSVSRRMLKNTGGYKLGQLVKHLGISINEDSNKPKSTRDCIATHLLYQKLIKTGVAHS